MTYCKIRCLLIEKNPQIAYNLDVKNIEDNYGLD